MIMKRLLYFAVLCLLFSSCTPNIYYQLYQTKPISDIKTETNRMVFEDENCQILYNFWREEGEIGFVFVNKTSENIYLHLDECFFIKNGMAYDYFKNRVYTNSKSYIASSQLHNIYAATAVKSNAIASANYYQVGTNGTGSASASQTTYKNGYVYGNSRTVTNSASNSVSTSEKPVICIPAKSSKIISEYNIKSSLYRSCDLRRYPRKKDSNSISFTQENSPLTFGNRIAYSVGDNERLIRVNNEFYVSKISNYSLDEITERETETECGKETAGKFVYIFKESGPDQFYISYPYDYQSEY